jgi:Leucine-rich repeat (LRR) protein
MDLHPELVETLVTTQDVLKRRPGSFHSLTDKATLVFSGQQIESLGSFAGYAKSINRFKKWDLSQNYIPEIPDDLAAASKVEDICLAENMLKSMKGFSGNQFLKVLDLSTNHISKIEYLDNLPELRILVPF